MTQNAEESVLHSNDAKFKKLSSSKMSLILLQELRDLIGARGKISDIDEFGVIHIEINGKSGIKYELCINIKAPEASIKASITPYLLGKVFL